MSALDRLARVLCVLACALAVIVLLTGCADKSSSKKEDKPVAKESAQPEDMENTASSTSQLQRYAVTQQRQQSSVAVAKPAVRLLVKGKPIDVPAPELENINRYAAALEENLQQRYNNTPGFAGKVAKVRLLADREPEFSLDRKKIRMEWSQIVFDHWGKRIPELEEEYYVVVFGDGKPLMQRTRPSITIGLNNESGYSEFSRVRGGSLSTMEYKADPTMFDKPESTRDGLLDDKLESKDLNKTPYRQFDIDPLEPHNAPLKKKKGLPVIQPAADELQAVVVLRK